MKNFLRNSHWPLYLLPVLVIIIVGVVAVSVLQTGYTPVEPVHRFGQPLATLPPLASVPTGVPVILQTALDDLQVQADNLTLTAGYLNTSGERGTPKYTAMLATYENQVGRYDQTCALYQQAWDDLKPLTPARECPTYKKRMP